MEELNIATLDIKVFTNSKKVEYKHVTGFIYTKIKKIYI